MSCCSVRWCGSNSRTSNYKTNGITFHRFPKDQILKKRWLDCIKRKNWLPSSYSVVCSRHFTEDCFDTTSKSRRRLFDTAIPTQNLPLMTNISVTENVSPIPSSSPQNESISSTPTDIKPETPSQFHSPTERRLYKHVLQLKNQVERKNKTIKVLQDKVRYYRKKVTSFKVMIKELEKKNKKTKKADK